MLFPPVTYRPLPQQIAEHARARPKHPAIIDGDQIVDYATLDDRIRRGAARLRAAGVARGDRIIVAVPHKLDLMVAVLAGMAAGASVLPLSLIEEDMAPIARYVDPRAIILDPKHPQASKVSSKDPIVPVADLTQAERAELTELTLNDIGLIILTSGTTQGHRRGAMLSHRALSGTAQYMNERMGVDGTVRDLVTAPLEHGFGMGRARCALHVGGTVVLQSGLFTPRVVVDELARSQCNMLSAAVSAVVLLLDDQADALKAMAHRMRWLEMGTGHLKPSYRRMLADCLPQTRSFMSYGLTEAIRCTFLELNADPGHIDTVGKPTEWVRVRIVDEDNAPLPSGTEGRIQVDGVNKASGYYGFDEAWNAKQIGDWLDTGDRGVIDGAGYLTFVGRSDDMINVGGLKVAPEEVETALSPLLAGQVFAVARIPDPRGIEGFVPALFIETATAPSVTLDQVRDHLRTQVPEFKIPRAIHAVDHFPRTATTNKIRRAALGDIAAAREAARIPKTTALVASISNAGPQNWPAIAGPVTLSRRRLQQFAAGAAIRSAYVTKSLAWLREAANTDDADLGRAVEQARKVFAIEPDDVIAVGTAPSASTPIRAITLEALSVGGVVLLLPPVEQARVAQDLGLIYRHKARCALVDGERFAKIASAERHLSDSFDYPAFDRVIVVGSEPDPELVTRFRQSFAFDPYLLSTAAEDWSMHPLRRRVEFKGEADLWNLLRTTAAGVFDVEAESLSFHSAPDNTPGWNSLGFMRLVAAVEQTFATRIPPRDMMAVRQLGDIAGILSKQANG